MTTLTYMLVFVEVFLNLTQQVHMLTGMTQMVILLLPQLVQLKMPPAIPQFVVLLTLIEIP